MFKHVGLILIAGALATPLQAQTPAPIFTDPPRDAAPPFPAPGCSTCLTHR
jgi:hypothetical protein